MVGPDAGEAKRLMAHLASALAGRPADGGVVEVDAAAARAAGLPLPPPVPR